MSVALTHQKIHHGNSVLYTVFNTETKKIILRFHILKNGKRVNHTCAPLTLPRVEQ